MPRDTTDAVNHIRDELYTIMPRYQMIEDCLEGEYAVKARTTSYLPKPNSADTSDENLARYNEYLCRAVFYNVTQRTNEGLVGQIFLRNPTHSLPTQLEPMVENTDGEGLSITQIVKKACGFAIPYGRGGFLADYPTNEGVITKAQLSAGKIKPTIKFYEPWNIVNWETKVMGNEEILTMVVLKEFFEKREPGSFQVNKYERYRVLELTDKGVEVTFHHVPGIGDQSPLLGVGSGNGEFAASQPVLLKDSNGKVFQTIPFTFIGAENNDAEIDIPPLYTMAVLNIAHYRNSADYEESVYFIGQPTLFIAGVTEDWVKDVWKGKVELGARAVIPGEAGSKADLIQVQPNTLAYEAMTQKEQQMIAVGAKLVERKSNVERKEAEIMIEAASDTSILTKIAGNVEAAFLQALRWCAKFAGANESEIEFEINKNFDLTSLTAQELEKLDTIINSERPMLAFEEVRKILERSGYTCLTLEEAQTAIEAEQAKKVEFAKQMMEATTPPQPVGVPSQSSN